MRTMCRLGLRPATRMLVLINVIIVFVFHGCVMPWDSVSGSGIITSETHEVSGFDAIRAGGVADVFVSFGDSWHVEVTTDDNLHEYLIVDVEGSTLNIRSREMVNLRPTNKLIVQVMMPEISSVQVSGSCNLYIEMPVERQEFSASASGSSDAHFTVFVERLSVSSSGSSDLHVSGFARHADISASGSSDFRGAEFSCNEAEVGLSGSSSAWITVNNRVSGNLSGSSDLHLGGTPEVNVRTSGSASIKRN